MSTPTTARAYRAPLGELPLATFLVATNTVSTSTSPTSTGVSPILKPLQANAKQQLAISPTRVKRSAAAQVPRTPPHHETHPVNVRPHHPHVASGLEAIAHPPVPPSPTTHIAPATPPASLLKRQAKHSASPQRRSNVEPPLPPVSCTTNRGSSSNDPAPVHAQSLPRKRDRVDDVTELGLARERGQAPVWASPSPHKNAALAAATAATGSKRGSFSSHGHRRMSSTGSTGGLKLSPKLGLGKEQGDALMKQVDSAVAEESGSDSEDEQEEEEQVVAVPPLRIQSQSPASSPAINSTRTPATPSRGSSSAQDEDVFGLTTSSPGGGLVVFCDATPDSIPTVTRAGHLEAAAGGDEENDSTALKALLREREGSAKQQQHKKSKKTRSDPVTREKSGTINSNGSSSSGGGGVSSPGKSSLPTKRKKGTGGRLSLVATGEAGKDEQDEQDQGEEQEEDPMA